MTGGPATPRRLRALFLGLAVGCVAGGAVAGDDLEKQPATTITEEAAKTIGLAAVPLRFRTTLVNSTRMLMESHGGRSTSDVIPVGDAQVFLIVTGASGAKESIETRSDLGGSVSIDAGLRYQGTEATVIAALLDGVLSSQPLRVGEEVPVLLRMFEVTEDENALLQRVFRIVTEVRDESATGGAEPATRIRVRQIVTLLNQSFYVYQVHSRERGYLFPVPEGAEVHELRVNQKDWPERNVGVTASGMRGIPIQVPVFPAQLGKGQGVEIMGTYALPVARGERTDFGLEARINTIEYLLGLESDRFHYLAGEGRKSAAAQDAGFEQPAGVEQRMRLYRWEGIPAGQRVTATVYHGVRPPMHPRTVAITLLFLGGGIALPIALGLVFALARRRDRALAGAGRERGAP